MSLARVLLFSALSLLALGTALAQDGDEGGSTSGSDIDVNALMNSIDLGPAGGNNEVTYEGRLSSSAPNFVAGKAVTITHTGGTIAVRCMDAPGITARLGYTIYGTNQPNMEKYGKGIGISSWGDGNGGGVKTRIPAKLSGISRTDIPLTVNLPMEAKVTVVGGAGWVQIIDCKGTVKSSNGDGSAYVTSATAEAGHTYVCQADGTNTYTVRVEIIDGFGNGTVVSKDVDVSKSCNTEPVTIQKYFIPWVGKDFKE